MPRLADRPTLRALLHTDRRWSAYALADLAPGFFEHAHWHVDAAQTALVMVLHKFDPPVLFTLGECGALGALLDEVTVPDLYLTIPTPALPLVAARYTVAEPHLMWRMVLDLAAFQPVPGTAQRLTPSDLPALQTLYADGRATGETPDFFFAEMLNQGVFYGVWEGPVLVAAAGTHVVDAQENVAAIGNVYTRRDRRGRGLAAQVVGGVTAALLTVLLPHPTVVLNVSHLNQTAQRVYQRLGFRFYVDFYEGAGVRPPQIAR